MQLRSSSPTPETVVTAEQADSEIREYLEVSQRQHALFPRAAAVGVCAGSVAVIFRWLLAAADSLRNAIIIWSHQIPLLGWILPVAFSATLAVIAVGIVFRFAPEAGGSGIPHLKAVLHRLRDIRWARVLWVKLIGGVLAIGSGMALGREGPTVQMGGAVGDGLARRLKLPIRDRLTLTAAGAGAGLAAAFNAPLSGLVFVLEEVQRDFRPAVFGAAFIAAASADIVARIASGQLPVFRVPDYAAPALSILPIFAVLGCLAGLLGIAFNSGLLLVLSLIARLRRPATIVIAALVGATAGIIAWFSPGLVGGGHGLAEAVLAGNISLHLIPLLFLIRFGLTLLSYGTGAAGGIFSPLLVLGAMTGLALGQMIHALAPAYVPQPGVFAVVGMAAYFTAIVRAPLTGVVLIVEMTGNYEQMMPLLTSCFCAYAVAEYLRDVPIYEALLERDLVRGGITATHEQPFVVDFDVEEGAPFCGKQVRELGLPAGCILVRYEIAGREYVPAAETRLLPHSRITAVITPEAKNATELLRRGCEAGS
jgi:chloride channel protein, CIC family